MAAPSPADHAKPAAPIRPVVLIGPMGSGKTSIGKRLARLLDRPFVDTDALIVARNGPIPALFSTIGEPGFRDIERAVVHEALQRHAVVSLGGGAVLHPATRAELAHHLVIRLDVSEQAVQSRLAGARRPLLTDGIESWRRIAAEREPIYRALALHTVDTSVRPITRIAEELAAVVRAAGAAGTPVPQAAAQPGELA